MHPTTPPHKASFALSINQSIKTINNKHMKKVNKIVLTLVSILVMIFSFAASTNAQSGNSLVFGRRVAVLPLYFIGDAPEEMRYRLQEMAHRFLSSNSVELKFQDPSYTNALLAKKGVTLEDLRGYMPAELALLLQVDYVVTGRVTVEHVASSTHEHSTRQAIYRRGNRGHHHHQQYSRPREHTHSHTRTTEQFSTWIDLSIHNSSGETIYTKSRKSILYDADAYKNGLHYLLKRSPLYNR
jgi:hypothetical protein